MKLVIEDDAGTRSIVPFASDELVVGRGEGVSWRLADRNVSRRHARFVRVNGVWFVEDLESLTGTLVNGERIRARRKLREGDLVQIGGYDLALLSDAVVAAGKTTPPPIRGAPAEMPPRAAAAPTATPTVPERPHPATTARAAADLPRPTPHEATAGAPRPPRLLLSALAIGTSGLVGLAAGYLAGWLRLL